MWIIFYFMNTEWIIIDHFTFIYVTCGLIEEYLCVAGPLAQHAIYTLSLGLVKVHFQPKALHDKMWPIHNLPGRTKPFFSCVAYRMDADKCLSNILFGVIVN